MSYFTLIHQTNPSLDLNTLLNPSNPLPRLWLWVVKRLFSITMLPTVQKSNEMTASGTQTPAPLEKNEKYIKLANISFGICKLSNIKA